MVGLSGPGGGYRLSLPPAAVTVGQVIRVLEGPLAIVRCMADHGDCAQTPRCTLRKPARKLQAAINGLLDTMTLADLGGFAMAGRAGGEVRNDGQEATTARAATTRETERS